MNTSEILLYADDAKISQTVNTNDDAANATKQP
jgi:hypothetical protein